MTKENINNRPSLRDVDSRAPVGSPSGTKRPTLKPSGASTSKDVSDAQSKGNQNRPALAGSSDNRSANVDGRNADKANSAASSTKIADGAFDEIHAFLSSLGDPAASADVDMDNVIESTQTDKAQTASDTLPSQSSQDGQNAPSVVDEIAAGVQTAGTERERLGLELNLSSIQLENTDYRKIGHRDIDDKPLATTIKGGISL